MRSRDTYIKAVLVVFGLLLLTRIPNLVSGTLDPLSVVSSIVELAFLVWGIAVLRK